MGAFICLFYDKAIAKQEKYLVFGKLQTVKRLYMVAMP